MQVHVSPCTNRITISTSKGFLNFVKFKVAAGHVSYRKFLYVIVVLACLLPFVFITTAIVTLENVSNCSRNDCSGRKWLPRFSHLDVSLGDSQRIHNLLVEAANEGLPDGVSVPDSYSELIAEIRTNHLDARTAIMKLKAMVDLLEQRVKTSKLQESIYRRFASSGIPKGLVCLSLKLTTEYSYNAKARRELPSPVLVPCLTDSSLHHYVLATDNVLAASVVVHSTVKNAAKPWKIVFHVVTDRKTYAAMHAWFALNPLPPAIIEVKGVHQFDWLAKDHASLLEALEAHNNFMCNYNGTDFRDFPSELAAQFQVWRPKQISEYIPMMNHLQIFLPELFPNLKKVILLDDDVVVQRDLSPLWDIDLEGKVNGAVETCQVGDIGVEPKTFANYFNFSHPLIAESLNPDKCAWAIGMNIFDLEAWRRTDITQVYHHWLKQNIASSFTLWNFGKLTPALIAFDGHVRPIDPLWHILGLGCQSKAPVESVKKAAVIHYSGQAKPWLDIAYRELRPFWATYVDYSNELLQHCKIFDM